MEISVAATGIVPVVMGLVSFSKNYIDAKFSPLVALVLCLGASFALVSTGDITGNVIQGIVMALMAAGLYSGGKTLGGIVRKA